MYTTKLYSEVTFQIILIWGIVVQHLLASESRGHFGKYGKNQKTISYSDIQTIKNCAPRDTCFPHKHVDRFFMENNFYYDEDWNDTTRKDWEFRNCFCDNQCPFYGDCCLDSPYYKLMEYSTAYKNSTTGFNCVQVQTSTTNKFYYMITTCPLTWENNMIRKGCEQNSEDPISLLPITNTISGATYKNYYCALCNNRSMSGEMELWKPKITCALYDVMYKYGDPNLKGAENGSFEYRKDVYGMSFTIWVGGKQIGSGCTMEPEITPNFASNSLRTCNPVVSNCPSEYNVAGIISKCLSYTATVYKSRYPDREGYRNVHCGICNGVQAKDLQCIKQVTAVGAAARSPPAFTFLFDLNPTSGNEVGRLKKCSIEEIYDPFTKKCRTILCSTGRTYKDGKCVATNLDRTMEMGGSKRRTLLESESTISGPTGNDTFETCPKIVLDKNEYDILDNKTISYRAYERNLSKGEYAFQDAGTILVCAQTTKYYIEKFGKELGYLSTLGVFVSVIFLLIHLTVFVIVPDLKNLSGMCLASLCIALLATYSVFLGFPFVGIPSNPCTVMAVVLYYSLMAAFCWMFVLSLDVSMTLRKATKQLRVSSGPQWSRFVIYSVFSWGFPFILTVATTSADYMYTDKDSETYAPNFGKHNCWFGQKNALLLYFILPIGIILLLNTILFFVTAKIISSASETVKANKSCGPSHQNFKSYLRLAVLMGISWIVGILAGYLDISILWLVFILLNTLQGLFIFIAFTCTAKVRKALRKKYDYSGLTNISSSSPLLQATNDSSAEQTTSLSLSTSTQKYCQIK